MSLTSCVLTSAVVEVVVLTGSVSVSTNSEGRIAASRASKVVAATKDTVRLLNASVR